MKIIDRHIAADVLIAGFMGTAVLSVFMILGNLLRELLSLLINQSVPLEAIVSFVGLVLPFSLPFTIPWGFLVGLLLVFGRLSSENELVALQSAGMSIPRLAAPVFLIALGLSAICFWINSDAAPRAKKEILSSLGSLASIDPIRFLKSNGIIDQLPGHRILIGTTEGDVLQNITIFETDPTGLPLRMVHAKSGRVSKEADGSTFVLSLADARFEERDKSDPSNVTRIQQGMRIGEISYRLPLRELLQKTGGGRTVSSYTLPELVAFIRSGAGGEPLKAAVEYHRRFAIAFACVAFAFVGIPLAITAHRKETSLGLGLSLLVAMSYFFLIIVGQTFGRTTFLPPLLLMWLPNLLFCGLGFYLFHRLNRR